MQRLNSEHHKIKFYMHLEKQNSVDNSSADLPSLTSSSILSSENKSKLDYVPLKLPSISSVLASSSFFIVFARLDGDNYELKIYPLEMQVRPAYFTEANKFSSNRSRCKTGI